MNIIFIILIIIVISLFIYKIFNKKSLLPKKIWILWLQGWENAPWLSKRVSESWEINNPDWEIIYISLDNLNDYVNDIDYIYDETKNISPAAKSDIIRLSLLKNHGGVWADATMLCLQPLDHWIHNSVKPSSLWMYHGNGGYMEHGEGPASWFIVSLKDSYMITKWKELCDDYWNINNEAHDYFWMDILFKKLFDNDEKFKKLWLQVPNLNCELFGQSNITAYYALEDDSPEFKELMLNKPPYAVKLCNKLWNNIFSEPDSDKYDNTNGYYIIEMSKRKFIYKHDMN